ncbi:MAG: N-acetylneuraminate synthase [Sediminibacterium magnilacihabitans]|nr:N-acetylneuraminate synthase [Sediminibacterium magnilacihabitans]PQV60066.1 N-acetylneuraminate synthase [Sediminibacterium magnilacihabitans]
MRHTLIIAEAGVNHNGDINIARRLIEFAAEAGADYIKFQTFKAKNIVSPDAKKAEYQMEADKSGDEFQFQMLKKLELSEEDHIILKRYAAEKSIHFLSTAFDLDSIDLLLNLGIRFFKVPSGEITNLPYLEKIAKVADRVIISTGMCEMNEIKSAVEVMLLNGLTKDRITVLHCNTEYPTPMHDVNLAAMQDIRNSIGVEVGYSDHTLGIEVPIAAVALGATVIEKHFTFDRTAEGPDHKASLEPDELKVMISAIRNIEQAIGKNQKMITDSERKNITIARKSIHLLHDIQEDEEISREKLIMLRPGDGISPMQLPVVIGKKATKNLAAGHKLTQGDFQ